MLIRTVHRRRPSAAPAPPTAIPPSSFIHHSSSFIHLPPARGLTLVEVIVVLAIVLVGLMIAAVMLPGLRESARAVRCRRNLQLIGQALTLYDNAQGKLPTVPAPSVAGASPIAALLGALGPRGFAGLELGEARAGPPGPPPAPRVVTELLCPSDAGAAERGFPAPTSYRATTGSTTRGVDGAFAIGRVVRLDDVRRGDGLAYTAGFSERLIGTGRDAPGPANYARVPGPVGDGPGGCGALADSAWHGDAGADWTAARWVGTLYNHAAPPGATPSCIAEDDATARMAASSGHVSYVHVLLLDGRVQPVRTSIDPVVWRLLGGMEDAGDAEE
jgi:prepilin-type N-terminal cleavage/methylation domain-containing protein